MRPPEVLQVNDTLWCHPKEAQNHSHGPFPGLCPAGGMTSNLNSWVFCHFQKTSKDTYFSPAPDQLILALTYSILFYLYIKALATCTVLYYLRLVIALVYCCSLVGLRSHNSMTVQGHLFPVSTVPKCTNLTHTKKRERNHFKVSTR